MADQIFENFIFSILYERYNNSPYHIHYWRTTDMAEVDFVLVKGTNIIPIEVKYAHLTKDKAGRSFLSFIEKYQPMEAYIINLDNRFSKKVGKTEIHFIPFYDLFHENFPI